MGDNSFSIRRRTGAGASPAGGASELGTRQTGDTGARPTSGIGEQGMRSSSGLARRESLAPSLHPSEVGSQIRTDREVTYYSIEFFNCQPLTDTPSSYSTINFSHYELVLSGILMSTPHPRIDGSVLVQHSILMRCSFRGSYLAVDVQL